MILPCNIQLFGPAQTSQSAVADTSAEPKWIGQVLSGSTHRMPFSKGLPPVEWARMLVLWAPRNTVNFVRLVSCDDGPTNIVELARLQGNGNTGPTAQAVDITAALNKLIAERVDKQLGFQVGGDGVNQWVLYEVQLEVNYEVGAPA